MSYKVKIENMGNQYKIYNKKEIVFEYNIM